jgi:hypothetical protein
MPIPGKYEKVPENITTSSRTILESPAGSNCIQVPDGKKIRIVVMAVPGKPQNRLQKYRITPKGVTCVDNENHLYYIFNMNFDHAKLNANLNLLTLGLLLKAKGKREALLLTL